MWLVKLVISTLSKNHRPQNIIFIFPGQRTGRTISQLSFYQIFFEGQRPETASVSIDTVCILNYNDSICVKKGLL